MQLSDHMTTLGGATGFAEVVFDKSGDMPLVSSTSPTIVASFTMPYAAQVAIRMEYTGGSSTSYSNHRTFDVRPVVDTSQVMATTIANHSTYPQPQPMWLSTRLEAGEFALLVTCATGAFGSETRPDRITVIAWDRG